MVAETISGSVAANQRPEFARLLDRLEEGDVLVVTKLDRLGRNAMDVAAIVRQLDALGVRVHCLQLGGVDLTSSTGKLTMGVINTVAEFERDLLIERTNAGLARARAKGVRVGRPPKLNEARRAEIDQALLAKEPIAAIARRFGVPRSTVYRQRARIESNKIE